MNYQGEDLWGATASENWRKSTQKEQHCHIIAQKGGIREKEKWGIAQAEKEQLGIKGFLNVTVIPLETRGKRRKT